MARFFFDIDDGESSERDTEGCPLPSAERARIEAVRSLTDIARDKLPDGDRRTFVATIRDARGHRIFEAVLAFRSTWLRRRTGRDAGTSR